MIFLYKSKAAKHLHHFAVLTESLSVEERQFLICEVRDSMSAVNNMTATDDNRLAVFTDLSHVTAILSQRLRVICQPEALQFQINGTLSPSYSDLSPSWWL